LYFYPSGRDKKELGSFHDRSEEWQVRHTYGYKLIIKIVKGMGEEGVLQGKSWQECG
jgi:hypothetical protein